MFTVFPDFRDGVLESLRLEESGEALGHPPGATVSLRTQRFRDEGAVFLDERGGYWYRRMAVGADTGPAYEQFVEMDERATKAQRDAALAFDFGCFTSLHGCRDGGEMLRPLGEPQ